jgi:hypothetical protein
MKKVIFIIAILSIMAISCKKENISPETVRPKYLDTCNCSVDDVFSNRMPADSCGTIRITNIGNYLPTFDL